MAKGRKLTTSRSERLLGSYSASGYGYTQGSSSTDSSELGEEDVWSMVEAGNGPDIVNGNSNPWEGRESNEGNSNRSRRQTPRDDRKAGGLSLAYDDTGNTNSPRILHQFRGNERVAASSHGRRHNMATSAPVNVPDWSKILRVDSVESLHELDDGLDDRDSEVVPPHEYLAREYARSRAATSVFEGVGRTLKGRDMWKVRDTVWSQTGFDG